MNININPESINPHFHYLLDSPHRYNIVYGGSSSSKSYSMTTFMVLYAIQGRSILVARKVGSTITKSIWSEVVKAISRHKLRKYFKINKSDRTIISKISNGSITFTGLDDPEKIKSITPPKADAFTDIIIEEATEISEADFNQILLRQRGKSTFKKRVWLLFNPIFKTHWIYKRFFKEIEDDVDLNEYNLNFSYGDTLIHKSTYRDNLNFLEQEEIDTLEDMGKNSPYHAYVYRDGGFGILGKRIYEHNVEYVDELPTILTGFKWRVGIDHGFNDYQTCVLSLYDGTTIYVVDAIAHREMQIDDFAKKVKEMFKTHGVPMNQLITADSSDPRANTGLKQQGLNVKKAIKGKSSVFAGIMWLKTKRFVIPTYLTNIKESVEIYQWDTDKNGESIDKPLHEGSDLLDAVRYSYELDSKASKTKFGRM